MKLEEVQHWARVKFGPYSQEYGLVVSDIHTVEQFLGQLIRRVESRGEVVDIGASVAYMAKLRKNPQHREA